VTEKLGNVKLFEVGIVSLSLDCSKKDGKNVEPCIELEWWGLMP
jgi:hypothetical protein